jgi:TolA-binding protein
MRSKIILVSLVVVSLVAFWRVVALSQGPGSSSAPAGCKNKERVQVLTSGSLVGDDTSKVNCTVDYWICGTNHRKSQIVDNAAGACDKFAKSVTSGLPKEVCCDCYPNCANDQSAQKKDCCDQVQQLQDQIKQLEERVKNLEDRLNGDDITLGNGASNIRISNTKDNKGVSINSDGGITINAGGQKITLTSGKDGNNISIVSTGTVSVKASGEVSIKGSKVTQN